MIVTIVGCKETDKITVDGERVEFIYRDNPDFENVVIEDFCPGRKLKTMLQTDNWQYITSIKLLVPRIQNSYHFLKLNIMFKNTFLFITTILVGISASNGYNGQDIFKGSTSITSFLDWFHITEHYVHPKGLIILDLIPAVFLIIQIVLFFKDKQKLKGLFAVLSLLANCVGAFIVIQYAYPIAAQMVDWTPDTIPSNWISLKDDWIKYIGFYGLSGILGLVFFLITYFVPAKKSTSIKPLHPFFNVLKNAMLFVITLPALMGASGVFDLVFFPIGYKISGTTFIEMHRPIDLLMRSIGPIMFTIMLSLYGLLTILFFMEKSKIKGFLILAAILFLLGNTFVAFQGNRPLNDLFLTWTPTTIPSNWSSLRDEWFSYHFVRNIFNELQLFSILLIYFVPINKSKIAAL